MRLPRIASGIGFLLLAYLGAWLILWLAGIDLMAWWPWKWFHGVPALAEAVRGSAIQAAVGWVGGVVGLGTFFLNRAQKQEHFDRQTDEARFVDIQDRFADKDSPMMRASAAIRLAEMAQTLAPGFSANRLDAMSYPFFPRVAAQLSAALHMEPEQAVRDEVKNALGRMVEFSKVGDQRLLYLLIEELKRSNHSAIRAVRFVLSMCLPQRSLSAEEELRDLAEAWRFCVDEDANRATWQDIADGIERRAELRVRLGEILAETPYKELQTDLPERSTRLCDTRDVLAVALRALATPIYVRHAGFPTSLLPWERIDRFSLRGAFLAGAYLMDAQLQGADLHCAQLQGAYLYGAQLQGANFFEARLQGAILLHASMLGANLVSAQLQGAKLASLKLLMAQTSYEARVEWRNSSKTQVQPEKWEKMTLDETHAVPFQLPGFHHSNWRNADFNFDDGRLDEKTYGWFIEHYGTDEEKRDWAAR